MKITNSWPVLLLIIFLTLVSSPGASAAGLSDVKTVFVILLENHDWSLIFETTNCPYIKQTLLPMASFCSQYYNPFGLHPSLPNYLWLEAGTNFAVTEDFSPAELPPIAAPHLASLLEKAGISWRTYQEGIPGNTCPTNDILQTAYVVHHNPFVYFADVLDFSHCTNHVRPYGELAADLRNNTVARYNFITPNLTNDMHDLGAGYANEMVEGDHWLSMELPKILASDAYRNNGAIFILWDEGSGCDPPIGCIVLSPLAKGHAYSSAIPYTHSSTLRTMQDIFGVQPYLNDAAQAPNLSDLFVGSPMAHEDVLWFDDRLPNGAVPGADGGDGWHWVTNNPAPFSGLAAHQSNQNPASHQHFFTYACATFAIKEGDVLFAYVYLNGANPPSEIMLQWDDGSWDHRAYWGANLLNYGVEGTAGDRFMGPLPPVGRWVRLEVPARLVALEGSTLRGMAFTLYGGQAAWDYVGKRFPTAASISRIAGGITISWPSVAGQTYRIVSKTNLTAPNWSELSGPVTATNSTTTWRDNFSRGQQFYRIVQ